MDQLNGPNTEKALATVDVYKVVLSVRYTLHK
jgi:hypothetical protein